MSTPVVNHNHTCRWAARLQKHYRLSFADKRKKNPFCFPSMRYICTENGTVYIYIYTHTHIYILTYTNTFKYTYAYTLTYTQHTHIHIDNIHMYIYTAVSNGKRKSRSFFPIYFPFAHRTNGSLSFVRLLTKEQTEVFRLKAD
jgi:hypothetical protein